MKTKTKQTRKYYIMIELKIPLEIEKIVEITDIIYTFNEIIDQTDLTKFYKSKLYDSSGSEISSSSSADGDFVGAYNFIEDNEYILRISSSNQSSHEYLRRYSFSITNG